MKVIKLRDGKERSLLRRHPWVFQGSIASGKADSGETVKVVSHDDKFLAWASFSPTSMIRVRTWSFDEAERIEKILRTPEVRRDIEANRDDESES